MGGTYVFEEDGATEDMGGTKRNKTETKTYWFMLVN